MFNFILTKFIRIANASSGSSNPFDPLNISENLKLDDGNIIASISPVAINIIKIFIGSVGIIFLFIIIYSGFVLIFSKGNSEKIKDVMSIISKAIIGIVIIFFSYAIIMFIMNLLKAVV
jgi:hypothetical protein